MYRAYCGIGSRDTPEWVRSFMRSTAGILFAKGWVLRSGGADGADLAFEHGLNREHSRGQVNRRLDDAKEIYLPWPGFLSSKSELHPKNYPFTQEEINVSAHFHPAWHNCSDAAKALHTRNMRQMVGLRAIHGGEQIPVKFVVCWTEGGKIKGGTGQALRIAEYLKIPVINFGRASNEQELIKILRELNELQDRFT